MARKSLPDHAGRMPDHPRYGNPSDADEEAERIAGAYENVDKWQRKYGAELSGGVSISVGNGPTYHVPIGQPEIAQQIVSRPIASEPEPPALPPVAPQSWFARLFNRIMGVFR